MGVFQDLGAIDERGCVSPNPDPRGNERVPPVTLAQSPAVLHLRILAERNRQTRGHSATLEDVVEVWADASVQV